MYILWINQMFENNIQSCSIEKIVHSNIISACIYSTYLCHSVILRRIPDFVQKTSLSLSLIATAIFSNNHEP